MARRDYENPPVHEVILDLQFEASLPDTELQELAELLSREFGEPETMQTLSLEGSFSPMGTLPVRSRAEFSGWEFSDQEPLWVLRVQPERLTCHTIRSDVWPEGEYIGWEAIAERFATTQEKIAPFFSETPIQRAGLRYINRIAIDAGEELKRFFKLVPPTPAGVRSLYTFSTHYSWAEIEDHEHLSATLRFGRIPIPEGGAEESVGILLDIDIFNLYVSDAPHWEETRAWFEEAHSAENELFENIITDDLRETFE